MPKETKQLEKEVDDYFAFISFGSGFLKEAIRKAYKQ